MSKPRVIQATFSTWRPVNGRKVLQLVFEVPIEQQGEVLTMLGAPDDKWVAIALLDPNRAVLGGASDSAPSEAPRETKSKRAFKDLPLSQQAGIRCGEESFRHFLLSKHHTAKAIGEAVLKDTATLLRDAMDITTRAELDVDAGAGAMWRMLNEDFDAWLLTKKYADAIR